MLSNRVATTRKAAAGGLAVALRDALRQDGGIWLGWSGRTTPTVTAEPHRADADGFELATLDLTPADYADYYLGFSNRTLWPVFHYRIDLAVYSRSAYRGYQAVNRRFARAAAGLLRPGDLIWVHDYHLIGVAQEMRRMGVDNRIGFFLHIPFPAPGVLTTLPPHADIVRALLAYDLIGFQAPSDLRALADYVQVEAGGHADPDGTVAAFGRTARAAVFPIGIDADGFAALAGDAEAAVISARLLKSGNGHFMIGVDRLDYTKALVERFTAFECLLTAYPEHRGRVTLLQIAPPSRGDVPEYAALRTQLEAASGHINGRFAEFDWMPVRYLNRPFARRALAALYRGARVGLVTPFRDGMNLVAKEYVAAQDPHDPGVLVLSRFAGAAEQLDGALIVNPYDGEGVADAMQVALKMPIDERQARYRAMMAILRDHDLAAWRKTYLAALAAVPEPRPRAPNLTAVPGLA